MLKSFSISVDLETQTAYNKFSVSQGDLNSIALTLNLNQDGKPVNLAGSQVRMIVRKPSGKTIMKDCPITVPENGTCTVLLGTQASIEVGTYTAELYIYKDDAVAVSGVFTYSSRETILNDEKVESTNDWQAIHTALGEAKAVVDDSLLVLEDLRTNGTGVDSQARTDVSQIKQDLNFKAEVETNNGFVDENTVRFANRKRIHLATDERWIAGQGHLSDLIVLQWLPRTDGAGAKPALVWQDENGMDKAGIIAHDKANNPEFRPHRHVSIETTMSPKGEYPDQLFTRMEFPFDRDVCEIQTHSSNFTVNGGYARIATGDGQTKEMVFARTYSSNDPVNLDADNNPIYDKVYVPRWSIRANNKTETGGNNGSDFAIVRYNDAGVAMDTVLYIKRSNRFIGIHTDDPQRPLDIAGDRIRIRNSRAPSASTDSGMQGDIGWDANYLYVAIGTNTWKRVALQTW
jgi:hypothetical protein